MEPTFDLLVGDVRDKLRELPADSIHAVMTSPPYWNLREYESEPQVWGFDPRFASAACVRGDHDWDEIPGIVKSGGVGKSTLGLESGGHRISFDYQVKSQETQGYVGRSTATCLRCGAWRGELGQEPTPQMYVEHVVEVFREVRRVLRPDGVVFLNVDDSYVANRSYQVPSTKAGDVGNSRPSRVPPGLKEKDLALVPQRLAISLQEDGWWVRCDVVWAPPNAMPESVNDRPTRAHEYVLMLTKSSRYFWDRVAVLEPNAANPDRQGGPRRGTAEYGHTPDTNGNSGLTRREPTDSRNLRSVWLIPTESYPGAHYAVMAAKLAERCILAATSEQGCCEACAAPFERIVETKSLDRNELPRDHPEWRPSRYDGRKATSASGQGPGDGQRYSAIRTLGWRPTCRCYEAGGSLHGYERDRSRRRPAVVLDPFLGSGTTTVVARRLGRSSVGVELKDEYATQARSRMETWWKDPPRQRDAPDDQLALV